MKLLERGPVFLHIHWAVRGEQGESVSFEATLCKRHREQIWLQNPSARAHGQLGDSCDLCEGRNPTKT
jgi:hypothetical protein